MGYRNDWFNNNKSDHGWYTCVSCGRKFRKGDVDIDHILPQNCSGTDSLDNLQCMCKHCNRSKQDDTRYTEEDYIANLTDVRIGSHSDIDNIDKAADEYLKNKRKKWGIC